MTSLPSKMQSKARPMLRKTIKPEGGPNGSPPKTLDRGTSVLRNGCFDGVAWSAKPRTEALRRGGER
jgi:hypothetical protein